MDDVRRAVFPLLVLMFFICIGDGLLNDGPIVADTPLLQGSI
jgi:hypothetical protein